MSDFVITEAAARDPFASVLADLKVEFGAAASAQMAREMIAAEELDFLWQAQIAARDLGPVEVIDGDRQAAHLWQLIGCLDGRWFVAKAAVDDDGRACDLIEVRRFGDAWDAYGAYA